MTLTTRRWRLTLVAIVATALGATLLADGGDRDPMRGWLSSRSAAGYRRQRPIANALQREGSLALREALYTLAIETRMSPTPRAATEASLQVIAADSIAARHLPTVRRVVDREWTSLGIGAQGRGDARQTPLRVIVVGELPDAVPVRFAPATRDASVGRFVLVPRTASDPCTVIVIMRRAEDQLLEQQLASGEGILGPCGFVAAFGLPAAGLRSALDSVGWRTAAFASWGTSVDHADSLRPAWLDLSAMSVGCLTRADGACLDAWRASADVVPRCWRAARSPPRRSRGVGPRATPLVPSRRGVDGRSGAPPGVDVVQASGPAAFGAAWRTSSSVEELFARTVGGQGGTWIAEWLSRDYRAPVITPLPSAREITWVLFIGALAALVIASLPRVRRRALARP